MSIKEFLSTNPESMFKLNELLRKYSNPIEIDRVLDRTINKMSQVRNPKNIKFSASESEATKFSLDDASKIIKKAKKEIPFIPDSHYPLTPQYIIGQTGLTLSRTLYAKQNPYKMDLSDGKSEVLAKMAKTFKTGNCAEQAAFCANESLNFPGVNKIEIFGMDIPSGHAFVVINRDENSQDYLMSTWGKNAIVIDSWNGIAFRASDYPNDKEKTYPRFIKGNIASEVIIK